MKSRAEVKIVPSLGNGILFLGFQVIYIHDTHVIGLGFGVGNPLAVGRIIHTAELAATRHDGLFAL